MLILLTSLLYANKRERLGTYKIAGTNIDASAAIGDLDRDGYLDIVVVSTIGEVIALNGSGLEPVGRAMGNV